MRALVCFLLFSLPVMLPAATRAAEPPAPNILFLLVDDLGYADLGCYGSQFHRTPEIDALARSGIRFTQAYSAGSVCSPTRASILTGRHPVSVGITDWIPGANANRVRDGRFAHVDDLDQLPLSEITLAETLAAAGYQNAFVGKWHLGGKGFLPTDQGFDINIGGFDVGSPPGGYYSPWKNPYLKNQRDGEYLTTRLTDESIAWLNTRDTQRPFFLMLSYYNVHTPIQPDRETIATYQADAERRFRGPTPTGKEGLGISRLRQDNPAYASMVGAVDRSVGRLLSWLEEQSLDQNTVVVLTSDNGGLCTLNRGRKADRKGPTCNLPLRSGKGWLYEGGIRVPAIIRLPKSIRERLPERDEPRQAVPSEDGPAQDGPAVVGSGQGRAEPKGGVLETGGVIENGGVIDTPINSFDWMPT
ncbi:MAG: sulfatase, partial [Planctomycetota bacterium]